MLRLSSLLAPWSSAAAGRARIALVCAAVVGAAGLGVVACYNPGDLGNKPFKCTNDFPECPDGYECALDLCPVKSNCYCTKVGGSAPTITIAKNGSYSGTMQDPGINPSACGDNTADHTFSTAFPIGDSNGQYSGLQICPAGDVDLDSIHVNAGEYIKVVIKYTIAKGDLDLAMYDGSGNQISSAIDADFSHDNACAVLGRVAEGTYYAAVIGAPWGSSTALNTYTLQVCRSSSAPFTCGTYTCTQVSPPDMSM